MPENRTLDKLKDDLSKAEKTNSAIGQIKEAAGLAPDTKIKVQYGTSEKIIYNDIGNESKHKDLLDDKTSVRIQSEMAKPQTAQKPTDRSRSQIKITAEIEGRSVEVFRQEKSGEVSVKDFNTRERDELKAGIALNKPEPPQEFGRVPDIPIQPQAVRVENIRSFNKTFAKTAEQVKVSPNVKRLLGRFKQDFKRLENGLRKANEFRKEAVSTVKESAATANELRKDIVDQAQVAAVKADITVRQVTDKSLDVAEKSATKAGSGLQSAGRALSTAGQKVEKAGNWLQSRPAAIRNHQIAKATLEAFRKGDQRISRDEYQLNDTQFVSREQVGEVTRYHVSEAAQDASGSQDAKPVMTFERNGKGEIRNIQQHSDYDGAKLAQSAKADVIKAEPKAEAAHAKTSTMVAASAKGILQVTGQDTHNGKHYKISNQGGELTITAKDGRGTIYKETKEGEVTSKLNVQDFKKFEPIMQHQSAENSRETAVVR
ncbi:MAG: hypothetical protein AAFW84_09805 [Cyanobacteria bacterium J06635_15]